MLIDNLKQLEITDKQANVLRDGLLYWLWARVVTSRALYTQAYFTAARKAHPDKGGSAESFAAVQNAFDVLSDPKKRLVYDTWAKELEYRYVRGVTPKVMAPVSLRSTSSHAVVVILCWCLPQAEGGEDKLLDEFENLGIQCDPYTQLIVTCEVCRRPSNKECWTCGMKICDFCTLKRHWKVQAPPLTSSRSPCSIRTATISRTPLSLNELGLQGAIGLHWPLINSDSLRESLGKRQLEEKKKDDARRCLPPPPAPPRYQGNRIDKLGMEAQEDNPLVISAILAMPSVAPLDLVALEQRCDSAYITKKVFGACPIPASDTQGTVPPSLDLLQARP